MEILIPAGSFLSRREFAIEVNGEFLMAICPCGDWLVREKYILEDGFDEVIYECDGGFAHEHSIELSSSNEGKEGVDGICIHDTVISLRSDLTEDWIRFWTDREDLEVVGVKWQS